MVRRMFEALDLNVLALVRIAIGPIGLGDLREGRWRHLQREEVMSLLREADPSRVEPNVD
jgi:16S rRNA U516 pseudouridylate synthase RsuA-like enzyme